MGSFFYHFHFSLLFQIFLILCSSLSCFVCLFPLIMASCLHPFLFWIPCCNYPFLLTDLISLTLFFFPCPLCKIMTSKCKMSNLEIRVFCEMVSHFNDYQKCLLPGVSFFRWFLRGSILKSRFWPWTFWNFRLWRYRQISFRSRTLCR